MEKIDSDARIVVMLRMKIGSNFSRASLLLAFALLADAPGTLAQELASAPPGDVGFSQSRLDRLSDMAGNRPGKPPVTRQTPRALDWEGQGTR